MSQFDMSSVKADNSEGEIKNSNDYYLIGMSGKLYRNHGVQVNDNYC